MTSTILYVSVDGNDLTAIPGAPTQPYTLLGAINQLNQQSAGSPTITLMLANGIYNLPCNQGVTLANNVNIIGTGPRNCVLASVNLTIAAGVTTVTMSSLSLSNCSTGFPTMLNVYGGILTLNNCEVTATNGNLVNLNNGVVNLNTCNVTVTGIQNPVINASNGGLIATNTNFIVTLPAPLTTNLSIIGVSPGTGFANLTSITLVVNLNGGSATVIPYYNINTVTTATTVVKGTGTESMILLGVDVLPQSPNPNATALGSTVTPQTPFYAVNLTTKVQNLAAVYSEFNLNNYPLVVVNLQWPGLTTPPGPYSPTSLQSTQLPAPLISPPTSTTPVITGPSGQRMMGPSGQPITAPSGSTTLNPTGQALTPVQLPQPSRYPPQGQSQYPSQGPVNQYPPQGGPSQYPPQGPVNQYPPQGGPSQYPPQGGPSQYPPQGGPSQYPPQGPPQQPPLIGPYPGLGGLGCGGPGPLPGPGAINLECRPCQGLIPPIETYDPQWDQVPGSDNLGEDIFVM
jgi:hypothetical protein